MKKIVLVIGFVLCLNGILLCLIWSDIGATNDLLRGIYWQQVGRVDMMTDTVVVGQRIDVNAYAREVQKRLDEAQWRQLVYQDHIGGCK